MKITIDGLWVLVTQNGLTGKIETYPRIFTDKAEADRVAKEFGYEVRPVFIHS